MWRALFYASRYSDRELMGWLLCFLLRTGFLRDSFFQPSVHALRFARPEAGLAPEAVTGAAGVAAHHTSASSSPSSRSPRTPCRPLLPRRDRSRSACGPLCKEAADSCWAPGFRRGASATKQSEAAAWWASFAAEPTRRTPLGQPSVGALVADGEVGALEAFTVPGLRGPSASSLVCPGLMVRTGRGWPVCLNRRFVHPFRRIRQGERFSRHGAEQHGGLPGCCGSDHRRERHGAGEQVVRAWLFGPPQPLPLRREPTAGSFFGRLAHGQRQEAEELSAGQVCGAVRRRGRGRAV